MTGWSLSVPVCLLGLTVVQTSEMVEERCLDFYQRAMDSVTDRCNRKLQIERQPQ
ncbi:uncharacterized protein BO88DRAFT_399954 [Aspergillus vadensis CBS 113365]|uniref:Uncharacterized protein n=1 Tax=Aspergillus vadensis (strain CBS 113365 / IMI 142717 / IBT 24658) TaxID=1448311 RepID=A0A319CFZ7_ASPVC|nr:hypothetical protein BO88DRAFT_399954 [Aspergillus vadensis CBS 113365]PYH74268.1 hypothetical protein BO88DRAFT_399954 [Aspergillus vadensis CBS 113365]